MGQQQARSQQQHRQQLHPLLPVLLPQCADKQHQQRPGIDPRAREQAPGEFPGPVRNAVLPASPPPGLHQEGELAALQGRIGLRRILIVIGQLHTGGKGCEIGILGIHHRLQAGQGVPKEEPARQAQEGHDLCLILCMEGVLDGVNVGWRIGGADRLIVQHIGKDLFLLLRQLLAVIFAIIAHNGIEQAVVFLLLGLFDVQQRAKHLRQQHLHRKQPRTAAQQALPQTLFINGQSQQTQEHQPGAALARQGAQQRQDAEQDGFPLFPGLRPKDTSVVDDEQQEQRRMDAVLNDGGGQGGPHRGQPEEQGAHIAHPFFAPPPGRLGAEDRHRQQHQPGLQKTAECQTARIPRQALPKGEQAPEHHRQKQRMGGFPHNFSLELQDLPGRIPEQIPREAQHQCRKPGGKDDQSKGPCPDPEIGFPPCVRPIQPHGRREDHQIIAAG